MRFIQITPGSGDNFYCENCLRDLGLVQAMRGLGVDMLMVPLYLPIGGQQGPAQGVPIFFGGINVYLQQKLALFRKTPRWLDRALDSRTLLGWVGRKAGMTNSRVLGETTVSMLQGRDGRQVKELDRLVGWLSMEAERADVICLSNALLLGLAPALKERLRVPVICLLQDEDGFVDGLGSPYAQQAWDLMHRHASHVDAFVAVSRFYAGLMKEKMDLPGHKVHVIPMGIPVARYTAAPGPSEVSTLGFLSRQCPARGLDTLVEAFLLLKRQDRFRSLRLRVSGGKSQADEPFIQGLRSRLAKAGVLGDVTFWTDFSQEAKRGFLAGLTVLSVPEKTAVAYGLYVLEALACGVPVVQPAIGVFPEILGQTGGGVLVRENTAEGLAAALEPLLADREAAHRLGRQGREGVARHYEVAQTAERMVALTQEVCTGRSL